MEFEDLAQYLKIVVTFKSESSRGVAIIGCAYLEDLLKDILKKSLVSRKNLFEEIDRLTFAASINFCHSIGKIDKKTRSDLIKMKDIRNEFAHNKNLRLISQIVD